MGALAFGALLVAVLALGFAAAFFGAAFALVLVAAVFALGAALALVALGLVSDFSFLTVVFFSAGLDSFFASLTGPDGPIQLVSMCHVCEKWLTHLWVERSHLSRHQSSMLC